MTRLLAGVLVAALVCGSCGGPDADGQARTVDPTTTTTSASNDTTTTTSAPAEVSLDRVVLQLSDMPTGWSVRPPEEEGDDSFCEGRDPFNEVAPKEEAESTFQQSDLGPFVVSGVSLYEDVEQASEVMGLLTDMANACQSFTTTEEDGTETEYTIAALSFPDLGDDTFAFRMSATTMLGPLNLDVAAVRRGSVVIAIINGGLGTADSELTESLIRTMIDRV